MANEHVPSDTFKVASRKRRSTTMRCCQAGLLSSAPALTLACAVAVARAQTVLAEREPPRTLAARLPDAANSEPALARPAVTQSLVGQPLAGQPAVGAAEPRVTGAFTTTVVTEYFFRGVVQEDRGFIVQPNLEITFPLFDGGEGWFDSGSLTLGSWNSVHSGPTGTRGGREAWYESDFYAELTMTVGSRAKVGLLYTAYASPNSAFSTVEEIAVSAGWDDKPCWGSEAFSGLQPTATAAFELEGQLDGGARRGVYGELAVSPTWSLRGRRPRHSVQGDPGAGLPVTLAVPVAVGLSLDDYYERGSESGVFGFVDVGLAIGVALPVPARLGAWTATMRVDLLCLGSETEAIHRGDGVVVVGSLALGCTF